MKHVLHGIRVITVRFALDTCTTHPAEHGL